MAGKRKPGTDLNHENWDKEEEAEDAGEFRKASTDSLRDRKIIRPKRRLAAASSSAPAVPTNPFASFGFSTPAATAKPFANFSFQLPSSSSNPDTVVATSMDQTKSESKPENNFSDVTNCEISSSTSEDTKEGVVGATTNDDELTGNIEERDPDAVSANEVSKSCPETVEPDSTESVTDNKIPGSSGCEDKDIDGNVDRADSLVSTNDSSEVLRELLSSPESSSGNGSP